MSVTVLGAVVAWGMVVGLDLISFPQMMVTRPLVAGPVAGLVVSDPVTGVVIGVILEMFASDVMPFGAARYPDYGVGTIAAVATAANAPGILSIGVAVGVGLLIAWGGEIGIRIVRHRNSVDFAAHVSDVERGDYRALRYLHARGIARDAARVFILVVAGLVLATAARRLPIGHVRGAVAATVVSAGIAIGTYLGSGLRIAGTSRPLQFAFGVGLVFGLAWVVAI